MDGMSHLPEDRSLSLIFQLCFGAMLVQVIQAGSGTLRTDYPSLILLVAAFFFPVGLVRIPFLMEKRVQMLTRRSC